MQNFSLRDDTNILTDLSKQNVSTLVNRVSYNFTLWTTAAYYNEESFLAACWQIAANNVGVIAIVNPLLGIIYCRFNRENGQPISNPPDLVIRHQPLPNQQWGQLLYQALTRLIDSTRNSYSPQPTASQYYSSPLPVQQESIPYGYPNPVRQPARNTHISRLAAFLVEKPFLLDLLVSVVLWWVVICWFTAKTEDYNFFTMVLTSLFGSCFMGPMFFLVGVGLKKFHENFIVLASCMYYLVIFWMLLICYYPVRFVSRQIVLPFLEKRY